MKETSVEERESRFENTQVYDEQEFKNSLHSDERNPKNLKKKELYFDEQKAKQILTSVISINEDAKIEISSLKIYKSLLRKSTVSLNK